MRASRPTIIEVRGSKLGLDIRGSRCRSRPDSAQMSVAGSGEGGLARSRLQPAADGARRGRTTLLSRPRSAERPAAAAGSSLRPGPAAVSASRPCSAVPRSVKTGPNRRRPRRPSASAAGVETAVKHVVPSSSGDGCSVGVSGGAGDAASAGDQTSCLYSTSSLSRWQSSTEPGHPPRRKGVTFSDTVSTDTVPAAAVSAGTSDSSATSPSEAGRSLPAAAATDELTRELLARGQQLRQGMARLMARQVERSGPPTPPDSQVEESLQHLGTSWDSQVSRHWSLHC